MRVKRILIGRAHACRVRRPWLLGLAGLGGLLAAATAAWVTLAPDAATLAVVAATELLAGRETALTTALALDVPWARAATLTTSIEWSMLLLGAPLLILGGDWLRARPFFQAHSGRAEAFARRRPQAGVLALAALTLAPFIPVGALTSVLVGELLRLPQSRLLPALALAELAANVGFAWGASEALGVFPHPRILAAGMAILLLGVALALGLRGRSSSSSPPR